MTKPHAGTFVLRFEPRRAQSGGGWEILVTWPDGQIELVDGLQTEAEADQWIEAELASWDYHQSKGLKPQALETPAPKVDPLVFDAMIGLRKGLKFHSRLDRLASTNRVTSEEAQLEVALAVIEHLRRANWRFEKEPPPSQFK